MPPDQVVSVMPVDGGWRVEGPEAGGPLMFLSEAVAEQHAHSIARRLAEWGQDVRVLVHDRYAALMATARYFADDEPATPPPPTP